MKHTEYFQYKKNFTGGTELMAELFHTRVAPLLPLAERFNCILLPGVISFPSYHSLLEDEKDIVLWLHNNPNEFLPPVNTDFFRNPEFHRKLRKVITVSEYAKEKLVEQSGISEDKVTVIHNSIKSVPIDLSKYSDGSKPKLIYVSQPERGLEIALKTLHERNEEFSFDIYCDVPEEFLSALPSDVMADERIVFHGRRSHDDVLEALAKSHIFVYPSTWYETFCISLVEALSAGCIAVYNSIGSLPEIGMSYGISYVQTELNETEIHSQKLNAALDQAFELLQSGEFNPITQRDEVLSAYSNENFITSWFTLASNLMSI